MTREEMIDTLVDHYLDGIFDAGAEEWINQRLRYGMSFKPYDEMTDEEIKAEYDEMFGEEDEE